MNWAHLEIFLVLYRAGSVARAAARLGVESSTVSRRLAALEEDVGTPLFLRTHQGLRPTEAADRLAPVAQEIEAKVRQASAITAMSSERPAGLVRVATPETVADHFLVPQLPSFLQAHPELSIELSSGSEIQDVAGLETDLALRFVRPDSGDVIAKHLCRVELGVFASRRYLAEHRGEWWELDWISWQRSMAYLPEARWLRENVGVEPRIGFNRHTSILAAVRSGAGVALLARSALGLFEDLEELQPPSGVERPVYDMWLVKPTIHRTSPAVNAVADWLVDQLGDDAERTVR